MFQLVDETGITKTNLDFSNVNTWFRIVSCTILWTMIDEMRIGWAKKVHVSDDLKTNIKDLKTTTVGLESVP